MSRIRQFGVVKFCLGLLFIAALIALVAYSALSSEKVQSQECVHSVSNSGSGTLKVAVVGNQYLTEEQRAQFKALGGSGINLQRFSDQSELVRLLNKTDSSNQFDVVIGVDDLVAPLVSECAIMEDGEQSRIQSNAQSSSQPSPNSSALTAENVSDLMINFSSEQWSLFADKTALARQKVQPPSALVDLKKPEYASLLQLPNPTTPAGEIFLLNSVSKLGDQSWQAFWKTLNKLNYKFSDSATDAIFHDFGASESKKYPLIFGQTELIKNSGVQAEQLHGFDVSLLKYAFVQNLTDKADQARSLILFLQQFYPEPDEKREPAFSPEIVKRKSEILTEWNSLK